MNKNGQLELRVRNYIKFEASWNLPQVFSNMYAQLRVDISHCSRDQVFFF